MPGPTKQAPPPLQVDTARVVLAGTALWAVALVVLLLLGDRVDRMWTWTCVAAIGLAILGLGRHAPAGPAPPPRPRRPPTELGPAPGVITRGPLSPGQQLSRHSERALRRPGQAMLQRRGLDAGRP